MNDAAINDLRALGEELAGALHSGWEPACLVRAFATPRAGELTLTMQQWMDLEARRSPLLTGRLPETAAELAAAAAVFALAFDGLTAEEAVDCGREMLAACDRAFATALAMRAPRTEDGSEMADGFGTWLPLWAFLVSQCGLSPRDAGALPVKHAYALMAATRRNQGWQCAGTPYALREIGNEGGVS